MNNLILIAMEEDELKDFLGLAEMRTEPETDGGSSTPTGNETLSKREVPQSKFYPSGDVGSQGLHVLNGLLSIANGGKSQWPLSEKWGIDCLTVNGDKYDCDGPGLTVSTVFEWLQTHRPVVKRYYHRQYTLPTDTCPDFPEPDPDPIVTSHTVYRLSQVTDDLLVELLQKGPVLVAIDVEYGFYSYSQGILERGDMAHPWRQGSGHAVTLVGYGSEDGVDYFSVKNSWGYDWGDKGYFRVRRLGGSTNPDQRYCHFGCSASQPTLSGTMPYGFDPNYQYTTAQRLPAFVDSKFKKCCVTVFEHRNYEGASKEFCGQVDWTGSSWYQTISSLKLDAWCTVLVYRNGFDEGYVWKFTEDTTFVDSDKVSALLVLYDTDSFL